MDQQVTISVIGGSVCDANTADLAYQVGAMIARNSWILVCGGLGGVMEAACRGSRSKNGLTLGVLPGKEKSDANPYVSVALPTSIGFSRNVIIACSAHVVIALPGSHGTSSEISYALVYKRPVIDMGGWKREGMLPATNAEAAEKIIQNIIAAMKV